VKDGIHLEERRHFLLYPGMGNQIGRIFSKNAGAVQIIVKGA
jgi:hypothetical protein